MAWHLQKIWYVKLFQTSTSKLSKFQAPNEKVLNIKIVPLDLTFPKSSNYFILDLKCLGCAWLKQSDIIWHGSNFKHQCSVALQSNQSSKHLIFNLDLQTIISWAYACPCSMASSFANFGQWKWVCEYHLIPLYTTPNKGIEGAYFSL
jgi:hypothetical protein